MVLLLRSLGLATALLAFASLSASIFAWNKHGARIGFWETSVQTTREVPIIEGMPELGYQQQVVWEEKLVLGIETLIAGILLFLIAITISIGLFVISSKFAKKIVE